MFAALRAKEINVYLGIVVTASHNPAEDNGVKMVNDKGEMLE